MVDTTKVTLIKTEGAYGTYAAPAAIDAVLTRNRRVTPIQTDQLERNLDLPSRGASPTTPTNERQTLSLETEMVGGGVAGTAPRWMELLRHAGMAVPTKSVNLFEQRFLGPGALVPSASLRHWTGDQERRSFGARATFSIDASAGAYPFFTLAYTGLLPASDNEAFGATVPPAVDLSAWPAPVRVNTENSDFLLDGVAMVLRSLRLDVNAEITVEELVGAQGAERGDHAVTGRVVVRPESAQARSLLSRLRRGAIVPMIFDHGVGAAAAVGLTCPNLQVTEVNESDQRGKLEYDIGVRATVLAGSDDLILRAGA